MVKRKELILTLRDKGITYEEIGEMLGISKQRAYQIANEGPADNFHINKILGIRFVGLRNWMLENRVKICELERMCGMSKLSRSIVTGRFNPSKKAIDSILAVTGMTYEECFKEEPAVEGQDTL